LQSELELTRFIGVPLHPLLKFQHLRAEILPCDQQLQVPLSQAALSWAASANG
jgi:hypothetical protein